MKILFVNTVVNGDQLTVVFEGAAGTPQYGRRR